MTEIIKQLAKDKELRIKAKECEDAKSLAELLNIEEDKAEQIFPELKSMLERNEIPEDLLEKVNGGCSGCDDCDYELKFYSSLHIEPEC